MDIKGCFNAIVNAGSSALNFGKDWIGKGFAGGCSLAEKVSQVAQRYIPDAVSKTVKAHPKSFSFVAGLGVAGVSATLIYRVFLKSNEGNTPPRTP